MENKEKWQEVIEQDLEIPQVVQGKVDDAFGQIRAGSVAQEAADAPVPPNAQAPANLPGKGRGKRLSFQRPWLSVAAAAVIALVVGGAFGFGIGATGSSVQQGATAPAVYMAPSSAVTDEAAVHAADSASESAEDEDLEAGESIGFSREAGMSGYTVMNNVDSAKGMASDAPAAQEDALDSDEIATKELSADEDGTTDIEAAKSSEKLVYTATVSIETVDYSSAKQALKDKAADAGAIVASENESVPGRSAQAPLASGSQGGSVAVRPNYSSSDTLTLRVPADNYEPFVESLSEVGTVVSKTSNVDNITKTYTETEAEIESLKTQKKRLMELLKKAEDVDDLLYIEESLQDVRSELAAQKNYLSELDTDVAYSTVTVILRDVSSQPQPTAELSLPEQLAQAASGAWAAFTGALAALLVGVVGAWPFLLVLIVVVVLAVAIVRRRMRRERSEGSMPKDPGVEDEQ